MSKSFSMRFHDPRCVISHSTLAGIETGALPSIHKMLSLAYCLRLTDEQILEWFGIDLVTCRPILQQRASGQGGAPTPLPPKQRGAAFPFPWPDEPAPPNTQIFGVNLPQADTPDQHRFHYARIGAYDDSMMDLVPPGSLVRVDTHEQRVQVFAWPSLWHRPIYLIWHPYGHSCCWCQQNGTDLLLISHPASHHPARRFRTPRDANIIGRVVDVWSAHDEKPLEFPHYDVPGVIQEPSGLR